MDADFSTLRKIAITLEDPATVLPYYRDVIGLKHLFGAGENLAFLSAGPVRIMLTTPPGAAKVGANSILYFGVTRIEL